MKPICMSCGAERVELEFKCHKCGGLFDLKPDFKYWGRERDNFPYIREWLDLGEVQTPLTKKGGAFLKLDYFSPTFSYKDRGARTLVSFLNQVKKKYGFDSINEDSSGNAGASIAAYGADAGLKVKIFVPERTSQAKIGQIRSYGAEIIKVKGSRETVQSEAENAKGIYASHVKMPEFRDGIRSLAYEIFQQLNKAPDHILVPVSAGTLLLGVYSGFKHLLESGEIGVMPDIVAVQTEAVSPLCARLSGRNFDDNKQVESVADALVSLKPPLMDKMAEAVSPDSCITVSEEEIIASRVNLARSGYFVEYSSATVHAAFQKKKFDGSTVLVMTGNGLKNVPDTAQAGTGSSGSSVP